LSDQAVKVSNPGILQVRRYLEAGEAIGDVIFDEQFPIQDGCTMVDPLDMTRRKAIPAGTTSEDLLVPAIRQGQRVSGLPSLDDSRHRLQDQLAMFHAGIKRLVNPHRYPVGLERGLHERKTRLILSARGFES
jgi:nicotinate phosphoribosyltransferase